jgi:CYTH domain-containing protein
MRIFEKKKKGKEIERRFLVDFIPREAEKCLPCFIRQGYLAIEKSGKEVRIRQKGAYHFFLCVKEGKGISRDETDISILKGQFVALWPSTLSRRVWKRQYKIPAGENICELNFIRKRFRELVLVEVEFKTPEASLSFHPPEWFGKEVTDDERYNMRSIAEHGIPE